MVVLEGYVRGLMALAWDSLGYGGMNMLLGNIRAIHVSVTTSF